MSGDFRGFLATRVLDPLKRVNAEIVRSQKHSLATVKVGNAEFVVRDIRDTRPVPARRGQRQLTPSAESRRRPLPSVPTT